MAEQSWLRGRYWQRVYELRSGLLQHYTDARRTV
jgi:hypothetical protein